MSFPGNNNYNEQMNRYDLCNYEMYIETYGPISNSQGHNVTDDGNGGHINLIYQKSAVVTPVQNSGIWHINSQNTGNDPTNCNSSGRGQRWGISAFGMDTQGTGAAGSYALYSIDFYTTPFCDPTA